MASGTKRSCPDADPFVSDEPSGKRSKFGQRDELSQEQAETDKPFVNSGPHHLDNPSSQELDNGDSPIDGLTQHPDGDGPRTTANSVANGGMGDSTASIRDAPSREFLGTNPDESSSHPSGLQTALSLRVDGLASNQRQSFDAVRDVGADSSLGFEDATLDWTLASTSMSGVDSSAAGESERLGNSIAEPVSPSKLSESTAHETTPSTGEVTSSGANTVASEPPVNNVKRVVVESADSARGQVTAFPGRAELHSRSSGPACQIDNHSNSDALETKDSLAEPSPNGNGESLEKQSGSLTAGSSATSNCGVALHAGASSSMLQSVPRTLEGSNAVTFPGTTVGMAAAQPATASDVVVSNTPGITRDKPPSGIAGETQSSRHSPRTESKSSIIAKGISAQPVTTAARASSAVTPLPAIVEPLSECPTLASTRSFEGGPEQPDTSGTHTIISPSVNFDEAFGQSALVTEADKPSKGMLVQPSMEQLSESQVPPSSSRLLASFSSPSVLAMSSGGVACNPLADASQIENNVGCRLGASRESAHAPDLSSSLATVSGASSAEFILSGPESSKFQASMAEPASEPTKAAILEDSGLRGMNISPGSLTRSSPNATNLVLGASSSSVAQSFASFPGRMPSANIAAAPGMSSDSVLALGSSSASLLSASKPTTLGSGVSFDTLTQPPAFVDGSLTFGEKQQPSYIRLAHIGSTHPTCVGDVDLSHPTLSPRRLSTPTVRSAVRIDQASLDRGIVDSAMMSTTDHMSSGLLAMHNGSLSSTIVHPGIPLGIHITEAHAPGEAAQGLGAAVSSVDAALHGRVESILAGSRNTPLANPGASLLPAGQTSPSALALSGVRTIITSGSGLGAAPPLVASAPTVPGGLPIGSPTIPASMSIPLGTSLVSFGGNSMPSSVPGLQIVRSPGSLSASISSAALLPGASRAPSDVLSQGVVVSDAASSGIPENVGLLTGANGVGCVVLPSPTSGSAEILGSHASLGQNTANLNTMPSVPVATTRRGLPSSDSLPRGASDGGRPRPYVCDVCYRKFLRTGDLNRHKKTVHEKLRKAICPICSGSFGHKGDLSRHITRVHEKGEFKKCEVCSSTFQSNAAYNAHRKLHDRVASSTRPFPCSHCRKCFESDAARLGHEADVHSTPKLYCEYEGCHESFPSARSRKAHVHEKHTTVFSCVKCNATFRLQPQLDAHMLKRHPHPS